MDLKELIKKWWFWVIVILTIILLYFILGALGITPMYQCGSTMGPEGPVAWCAWHRGILVG